MVLLQKYALQRQIRRCFFNHIQTLFCIASACFIAMDMAYAGETRIEIRADERCIRSDGLPNHTTGTFPNGSNPNRIAAQDIDYCFPLNPIKNSQPQQQRGSIGVALNGVTIRPGTADYWDPNSTRGHSRDRSSGWNLEGMGSRDVLGMDHNNAHVDNRGLYHYHGVAADLVSATPGTLIGYAADGFEIHYVGTKAVSSYQLKPGNRTSGPGGRHDGTYNQDWQYVSGSDTLDRCNGGTLNGKFVYFATDTYPFFPRCLWGNASADFAAAVTGTNNTTSSSNSRRERKLPTEAITACLGKSSGVSCQFNLRGGTIRGRCRIGPDSKKACMPSR